MASDSLNIWFADRAHSLDEIENAHRAVGGSGPGRRYATRQINHAYAMLLSSHFQGFCRDLHTECVNWITASSPIVSMRKMIRRNLELHRKLDTGNPNSGNIGSDFNRFDIQFWDEVVAQRPSNASNRTTLDELNVWRNAIAHQDFDYQKLGKSVLWIRDVRQWRRACTELTTSFDDVMRRHLISLTGNAPW